MRQTKKAFNWIISILEKNKIKYRVSGGFAARFYGAKRHLADIDIELPRNSIEKLLPEIQDYVVKGPNWYKDKEWDCYAVELKYKDQELGLAEIRKIFDKNKNKWVKFDFSRIVKRKVYGKIVNIITKEDLVAYKSKIRRKVDLQDLKWLSK